MFDPVVFGPSLFEFPDMLSTKKFFAIPPDKIGQHAAFDYLGNRCDFLWAKGIIRWQGCWSDLLHTGAPIGIFVLFSYDSRIASRIALSIRDDSGVFRSWTLLLAVIS